MKKLLFKIISIVMIAIFIFSEGEMVFAQDNPGKIYRRFLKRNESKFVAEECNWDIVNSEDYKKTDNFLLVDLNKDGVQELVCTHPVGYKQSEMYIYTIKNGMVKQVKGESDCNEVDISTNAAGYYDIYSCKAGHLHVNYNGGWMGYENKVYSINKHGKFSIYLEESALSAVQESVEPSYFCNGIEISRLLFDKKTRKCERKDGLKMNNKSQRNKIRIK